MAHSHSPALPPTAQPLVLPTTESHVLRRRRYAHLEVRTCQEALHLPPTQVQPVAETQIIVLTAGAMRMELQDDGPRRSYQAQTGDLFLTGPHGQAYEQSWTSLVAQAPRCVSLYLSNQLLALTAATESGADAAQVKLREGSCIPDPLLRQLSLSLAQELETPENQSELYADTAARMLAVQLVRQHCARSYQVPEYRGKLLPQRLSLVRDYVQAHLAEPILLESLAAEACLSPYHFCRLFKQTTGQSPNQYVIQQRMERAVHLLRSTDHSVTQVAYAVGYRSLGHFAQLFQRHTGCAPTEFQRWPRAADKV
ncbi:AraC family transcriptional regulator [Hymenobacter sp. YC55]|uniref:helix-turn-helix domain-containing protein n=1 Tax=Hymenobacter sp. YC55 TaxID=3034019 RepID=UPI0023F94BF7|nr:AraC family transcriptional regulator [Hymenobacter sp. YC55]MDF7815878.1 AraC family transcriptional regulator [Hymenobacter sp. YC55]